MMSRTIQVEKLHLACGWALSARFFWIPKAMSATKVTAPSGLQYIDLTVGNGEVAKAGPTDVIHASDFLE
jgi:hypothetical protein